MTKLALGLALAGMFIMGYFSGGSLKDRELHVQSRPKPARSEQQSFSSRSQTNSAYEAATGQVEASRLELAMPLVTTATADTAQFSKLMLGCKDAERAWRGRVLSPVVTT